jgi:hypothetical protein
MTRPTAAALHPIEIFAPGQHKAAAGDVLAFSASDLEQTAGAYNPNLHRAPLVVGHPKTDDLAYGHVAALSFDAQRSRLIATPADVEPAFADLVGAGRLLAVSASFYTPGSANNPVPGCYYLRHVGFLGAEAPAVKGLKRPSVAFGDGGDGVVEFSDWGDGANAGLWRRMREWLISKFGLEEADQVVPGWQVQAMADEVVREETERAADSSQPRAAGLLYSEGPPVTTVTHEQLAAQAAQLAAERTALDARQAEIEARERAAAHAARMAEFAEFTSTLVKAGQLLPVHQASLVAVMASMPDAQMVEFAEGDTAVTKPAVSVLKDFLAHLPKIVEFRELAAGRGAAEVDLQDAKAIARAAAEFRDAEAAAGRTVTLEAAVQHIVHTHSEA